MKFVLGFESHLKKLRQNDLPELKSGIIVLKT